jgi:hypothetical protein
MLTKDQKLARLTAREYIASLQEIKHLIGDSSKTGQIQVVWARILVAQVASRASWGAGKVSLVGGLMSLIEDRVSWGAGRVSWGAGQVSLIQGRMSWVGN